MNVKTGLQLYSVRKELAADFDKTLELISGMGFEFVELAGLHFKKPEDFALKLHQNRLKAVSMHCDVLTDEGLSHSLKEAEILNCDCLVCPWVDPLTFSSEENIIRFAEKLNKANQQISAKAKTLCFHNHDFEFQTINGKSAFDLFVAQLHPDIKIQLDIYNAAIAGVLANEIFDKYVQRINIIHLKDGEIDSTKQNVAVGSGKMDYNSIFRKIPKGIQWQFIEFENCQLNIFEEILKSKCFT